MVWGRSVPAAARGREGPASMGGTGLDGGGPSGSGRGPDIGRIPCRVRCATISQAVLPHGQHYPELGSSWEIPVWSTGGWFARKVLDILLGSFVPVSPRLRLR